MASVIDWDLAVATGTRLVRPGPQISMEEARKAVAELRRLSREAEGHVRDFTGIDSAPPEEATVVDRPGWIKSNVEGFKVVLEPLTAKGQSMPAIVSAVGSRITGLEVGAVLAFLATRVLGQYEIFLPPSPDGSVPLGRLTLVAPNIVNTEREMNVDPRDFRLWVCLHEETHRVQFTGVPWLRGYLQGEVHKFLTISEMDLSTLLNRMREVTDAVQDAFRGGESNLLEAIQTPEQKAVLDRVTAVMTLVEGHGDYVMDAVGPTVVPSVVDIRGKFQRRRDGGSRVDQVIRRLLGIDLKMKQYAEGSNFVKTVVDEAGMEAFNRVWTSPETLPTRPEILDPQAWMRRVLNTGALTEGTGGPPSNGSSNGTGPAASPPPGEAL